MGEFAGKLLPAIASPRRGCCLVGRDVDLGPIPVSSAYSPQVLQKIISPCLRILLAIAGTVVLLAGGCDENHAPPAGGAGSEPDVRIASLVPAVTNMLLELDAADHLVAVSNYDTDPRVADLPRVGDLLSIDWEQLLAARPTHMVIQQDPAKVPEGLKQRAEEHQIDLVSVPLTRLADIKAGLQRLGDLFEPSRATEWTSRFERELQEASSPRRDSSPRVLIALSADLQFVAGRENYLHDLLFLAGGENVVGAEMPPYPTLDDEALLQLRPQRVVVILPSGTPAQIVQAEASFARLQQGWGLPDDALTLITDPYAMVPGWSVIEVLKHFRASVAEAAE